jgi:hypothetical protein
MGQGAVRTGVFVSLLLLATSASGRELEFEWRSDYVPDYTLIATSLAASTVLYAGTSGGWLDTLGHEAIGPKYLGDGRYDGDTARITHSFAAQETFPEYSLLLVWLLGGAVLGGVEGSEAVASGDGNALHDAIVGYTEALTLTLAATQFTKVAVGRLRPDFIDRVQSGATGKALRDGGLSFFSGHALARVSSRRATKSANSRSVSFATTTYLGLVLGGRYLWGDGASVLDWGEKSAVIVSWAALTGLATGIAVSRYLDGRHHWEDLVVGSLVGVGLANFSYWRRFDERGQRREGGGAAASRVDMAPSFDMNGDVVVVGWGGVF